MRLCSLSPYLYRTVKETIELNKASGGVRTGWRRLGILVDTSWLTENRVSVAENDQASQESTHEESSKHAGDEDVHVDHLVGFTCLNIPHTYKILKF